MTLDKTIELEKVKFNEFIHKTAVAYVAPLFWERREPDIDANIVNGSFFFLDCGEGPFGVTACHVIDEYFKIKKDSPGTTCQVMNLPFDPKERLIDHDPDIDLATFRISDEEIKKVGKEIVNGYQQSWPPAPPETGKGLFLAGFPNREIIKKGKNEVNFGSFSAIVIVASVNDREISIQFDREYTVAHPGLRLPPEDYNWGGISGAPVLAFVESNGVLSWRLAGVALRRHRSFNILKVARADRILPDGRLQRRLLP